MSHLHRGRFIRLQSAKGEKAKDAVRNYRAKPLPAAAHVATGAAKPRAKAKASAKRRR